MSQTAINKAGQPIAVAGQLSDNNDVTDIVSKFSQEASAEIAFGLGLCKGSKDHGVLLPALITDPVVGVNVWGPNHMPGASGDLGTTGLKPKAGIQCLRKGRIYVQLDTGISSIAANSDRAFLRFAANGGNTVIGRWGKATDAGMIDLTKVGVFTSSMFLAADGTKIAEVEFDFTNKP